jgi:undecaprenyl-diphosphatase
VQGPAELLPVSSSGHVALLPHLLGWDARSGPPPGAARSGPGATPPRRGYAALPPHLRKTFEVALHAGAGAALVTGLAAVPLARGRRWRGLAAYRIALGAATLWARGK